MVAGGSVISDKKDEWPKKRGDQAIKKKKAEPSKREKWGKREP